ncbi:hypothetical protein O181_012528 [Austropuccinia psidii MF-1]|uniref:Uncharacterized protein n=1 Tax=Austropuccinia psidii MF-1 TaxID=1389203 RepID=A0A9Q3BXG3_9BASI|nr:hypothetical protein [Austropuccinia psidii MF-1]
MLGFQGVHGTKTSTTWPGPIQRVQDNQEPDLPKVEGEVLASDLNPRGPWVFIFEDFEGSHMTGSGQRDVARWADVGGPIPVGGRPINSSSKVPISRLNTEGLVKRIRQISNSPPDPDAEGSDELDDEEVEVVHNSIGHQSSTSPSHPPSKTFQIHIIPRTPRTF